MSSPPPSKKRKRSRNVACNVCRTRHEKCDGKTPCGYCVRTNNVCTYPAPKKRGPKPGYRQAYLDRIAQLEKLVAEQQKQISDLTAEREQANMLLAPNVPVTSLAGVHTGVELLNYSVVKDYAQQFHTAPLSAFLPMRMLLPPEAATGQMTPEMFQLYGLAAFGALMKRNMGHYKQLLQMCYTASSQLHSTLSGSTVAGNVILSSLLFFKAEFLSARRIGKLALDQAAHLVGLSNSKQAQLLLAQVKMHRCKFLNAQEAIDILRSVVCDLLENGTCSGSFRQILIFSLLHQVQLICDINFMERQTLDSASRQTCLLAVDRAQQIIQLMTLEQPDDPNLCRVLRPLLRGVRGNLYLACGNANKAATVAEALLEQLVEDGEPAFMSPLIIKTLLQIFSFTSRAKPFEKTMYYLRHAAAIYPLAAAILEYMTDKLRGVIIAKNQRAPQETIQFYRQFGTDISKEKSPCPRFRHNQLTLPNIIAYFESKRAPMQTAFIEGLPNSPHSFTPESITHESNDPLNNLDMDMSIPDLNLSESPLFDIPLDNSNEWSL